MRNNYLHAYAILRYEAGLDDATPIDQWVTVKKVVFDPAHADEEVKRLNDLNASKGAYYFTHVTRLEQPAVATATVVASVEQAA